MAETDDRAKVCAEEKARAALEAAHDAGFTEAISIQWRDLVECDVATLTEEAREVRRLLVLPAAPIRVGLTAERDEARRERDEALAQVAAEKAARHAALADLATATDTLGVVTAEAAAMREALEVVEWVVRR